MSGIYRRCKPVRDRAFYDQYLMDHTRCFFCGQRDGLSRHHIIGGVGRSDEACNLTIACLMRCHPLAEGERVAEGKTIYEPLTLGMVLSVKKMRTPDEMNLERLTELYGQTLPDFEQPPAWIKPWR